MIGMMIDWMMRLKTCLKYWFKSSPIKSSINIYKKVKNNAISAPYQCGKNSTGKWTDAA
jgi:hypothetical protein